MTILTLSEIADADGVLLNPFWESEFSFISKLVSTGVFGKPLELVGWLCWMQHDGIDTSALELHRQSRNSPSAAPSSSL